MLVFDFVDLFAGVGGFHAALSSVGGRAVQASEIDPKPAAVYESNWGLRPDGDVRALAADAGRLVKDHAVLTGGFPCQPFSKSGRQLGVAEDRGTLFHDIIRILQAKTPPVVMLENVRNIAGPRQREAWHGVVDGLRSAGYRVSSTPCVFSPHLLAPDDGGAAQLRERVYIMGVHVGRERALLETAVAPVVANAPQNGWDPWRWRVADHVLLEEPSGADRQRYAVDGVEADIINTWNELLALLGPDVRLPGFPMWEPMWRVRRPALRALPPWKQEFVKANHQFYLDNRGPIDEWRRARRRLPIARFPMSRRKLEWQAQDGERDLWQHLVQMRPSGIRVKRATWTPALVAMNQTPIYGPGRRRLTPLETARLQGFDPSTFSFGGQAESLSYKQMGNAVNVGAAAYVFRRFVEANAADIAAHGPCGRSVVETVLDHVPPAVEGAA
ncbi:DNA (cytosine-5-)-methyltransferase [Nocardioides perillae]|uniref:DNA (cytosine-5-)-methyltransferase n=1 Tax=Nocardioides perillae TaxID=1119534 RepID=A0A7Y9ULD1_9ACTN|nr:DNA (cytosine-5)-methyltransferase 1 [Nocardioides perillae]